MDTQHKTAQPGQHSSKTNRPEQEEKMKKTGQGKQDQGKKQNQGTNPMHNPKDEKHEHEHKQDMGQHHEEDKSGKGCK